MTKEEQASGLTPTERFLSEVCRKTFLNMWVYPNTFYEVGKELCDVLVVFEDNVFIFSVKDISFNENKDPDIAWQRWKRKAIDESIKQIEGAVSRLSKFPDQIFLDAKCTIPFPIRIPIKPIFHRIIVAHGAEKACLADSEANIRGSLGVSYSDRPELFEDKGIRFSVSLPSSPIYHVFDDVNLRIMLSELDTISDLTRHFDAKAGAIGRFGLLSYCGEEDLLAHYFFNFDEPNQRHVIGPINEQADGVSIGEGEWDDFYAHKSYQSRKETSNLTCGTTCFSVLEGARSKGR
jgi:hypothetical protein